MILGWMWNIEVKLLILVVVSIMVFSIGSVVWVGWFDMCCSSGSVVSMMVV